MTVPIRRADPTDKQALVGLYRTGYRVTNWPSTVESVTTDRVETWLDERTIFVGLGETGPVGAVQVRDHWVKRLVTRPDRRRSGIGRKLLQKAEKQASEADEDVTLRANEEIDWLVDWYRQRGYRVVEHEQLPDYPFDTVIMKRTGQDS